MFGVHVDGWTYRIVIPGDPQELHFTHFTGNDQWANPYSGVLYKGPVNLTTWENAAKGT